MRLGGEQDFRPADVVALILPVGVLREAGVHLGVHLGIARDRCRPTRIRRPLPAAPRPRIGVDDLQSSDIVLDTKVSAAALDEHEVVSRVVRATTPARPETSR
ncbi:hypothetical protein B0T44_14755 [Nocardia donostiensis]|uniref:Uncharacterized protein n=1 Tax=Nocardia donostiensis TaxID=1538463 RepID=A0A1V2TAY6_9NOCA|nr:hypothetical protein B0T46_21520 [Nocardia donostiensis]OQS12741.1 hypothetical protein B0T36_23110 [Nocardia donostiensis]OQS19283.1 hypothetical protein B0T44_14755 [Nocardia donostiensis]